MEKFVTRAARLNKAYDIELIERELECGEDDIIVKNHMMGICGSDKSFYRGFMPPQTAEFRQPPEFPFLLGHESGGTVVAVAIRLWHLAGTTTLQTTLSPKRFSCSQFQKDWIWILRHSESRPPVPCTPD